MKLFLSLLFALVYLQANCTPQQIEQAQALYNQTEQTQNPKEQIELLSKALNLCYSAEIEANYLILKAEEERDINQKIGYYKEALISISKFQEQELILLYQDEINMILANLYEPIDSEIAKMYRSKVRSKIEEKSRRFEYGVYFLFSLLFLWAFWEIFRKK